MFPNITGKIRNDRGGDGAFWAPRTKTVAGITYHYRHKGIDYEIEEGKPVWSPCIARVVRIARPYVGHEYSGLLLEAKRLSFKIFYLEPSPGIVGANVREGEILGYAQAISKRYPSQGITDHVHLEFVEVDPMLLMGKQC